jgi:signal transduction histidine kinase
LVWDLVGNAVKFTPRGRAVRISARDEGSSVAISVADEGEGIDPRALPIIFDPFRQAEGGTTRRHGGLGLGLAIARRIAELHGGRIEARSDGPGAGSEFTVTLPVSAVKESPDDVVGGWSRRTPRTPPDGRSRAPRTTSS